jgi:hypothetical protein
MRTPEYRVLAFGNAGNDDTNAQDGDDRITVNGGDGDEVGFGHPDDGFVNCEMTSTLRQRLDAVAGSDRADREHVGSQPAPVHEAAQHPGPR